MIEMTKVNEQTRTYVWPDGGSAVFEHVTHFGMPGSTHRLRLGGTQLAIVKPDWRYIIIDAEEFTL